MKWGKLWTPNSQLPPHEYWLVDPRQEKMPVPLDDRGLVDSLAVAQTLRSTIDPRYKFHLKSDDHHEQHDEDRYKDEIEKHFRTLPINIVKLPRDAHVLLHHLFEEPIKPDREVMKLVSEGFSVTNGIYTNASEVIRLERHKQRIIDGTLRPKQGEFRSEISRQRGIDFHKRQFEEWLQRYENLPTEAVLEPVRTGASMKNIAKTLGASAIIRMPRLRLNSDLAIA